MNTKIKIALGVFAGLIAGTTLVGTAFAAPSFVDGTAPFGYAMMGSSASSQTLNVPSWSEMLSFMDRYRNADGTVDVNRMHADVVNGQITRPCLTGDEPARGDGASAPSSSRSPVTMPGWTTDGNGGSYGMMGGGN